MNITQGVRLVLVLAALLGAAQAGAGQAGVGEAGVGEAGAAPSSAELDLMPARVAVMRDFSLSFDHTLGKVEAKRRVAARLETLRAQFADKIGESTITWSGDVAEIRVAAFGQTANAWVSVGDTDMQIHVHLPLLLSPLGGNIAAFLTKTAHQALKS